ncbi:MAG: amidohydrolase family protein, partial [Planctomycetota bacterium]|nr:amidohydrolase family protein [Planctomycetota bacterium]
MAKTLIQGGTVVTATEVFRGDVLVDGERVEAVGCDLSGEVDRTIDATDRLVIPGGIDVHTHLDMPFGGAFSVDDFETGTIAAAHGGTTTVVDFAIQERGKTLRHAWESWMAKAEGKAAIDYGFHMILGGVDEAALKEMDNLVGEGISSFKLFMAYPGVFYSDDGQILRAM